MNHIPGTLLFDLEGNLVYFNEEALAYLPRLRDRNDLKQKPGHLPPEILALFQTTRDDLLNNKPAEVGKNGNESFYLNGEEQLSLRSFPIGHPQQTFSNKFILLLIEPASQENHINFPRAARIFQLSKRELEVVQLICRGKTNKEIGNLLFISEQTAKDHIKNIMRKFKVSSRTQILAALLNLPKTPCMG
ncbi:MAG: helix-turn-helix transcriptional regulator [Thermodesulfobacteriota bacterium]